MTGQGAGVREVRLLGATWRDRGPRYWVRRVFLAILYWFIFALVLFFLSAFITGFTQRMGQVERAITLAVVCVAVVWNCYTAFRALVRMKRGRRLGISMSLADAHRPGTPTEPGPGLRAAGLGLGVGALGGSPIAAIFLAVGNLFTIGWLLVLAIMSLQRYLSPEEYEAVTGTPRWRPPPARRKR